MFTLENFNQVEKLQQSFIDKDFNYEWHLFAKFYSGTWWSAEQCVWIDAIRQVAEDYKNDISYDLILSSLMYAMAYTSQGTGHYAQYRDANTEPSMRDILRYRKREVKSYFKKKFNEAFTSLPKVTSDLEHVVTSLDFKECLQNFEGGTIYADPPYCFVHYSRFYHALETLVLYDYPKIQKKSGVTVKGRYREERHQSPFCIKSQVKTAFSDLFIGVKKSNSNLVLSYSNTGMITMNEIDELARIHFPGRTVEMLLTDHRHMTLGRLNDHHRKVKECLIMIR